MNNTLLAYFNYAHLPKHLQDVSKPFGDLADLLSSTLPDSLMKEQTMLKLLEAKDCAVRSSLSGPKP